MTTKLEIITKKVHRGHYEISRSDGRVFKVIRSLRQWVIEAQDTYAVDGAPTLCSAKLFIQLGSSPVMLITPQK